LGRHDDAIQGRVAFVLKLFIQLLSLMRPESGMDQEQSRRLRLLAELMQLPVDRFCPFNGVQNDQRLPALVLGMLLEYSFATSFISSTTSSQMT